MIEKGTEDWKMLFDLAAIGHIPAQLLSEPKMEDRRTVFFRMERSDTKPSAKQIKEMIDIFKGK